jgi:hypothetical protein
MEANEAAKRVFIAYRQLEEILKSGIGFQSFHSQMPSYNRILTTLKQCFAIDPLFQEAVEHLETDPGNLYKMTADAKVLLATAHSFIELYLSPEDKKKSIGFGA